MPKTRFEVSKFGSSGEIRTGLRAVDPFEGDPCLLAVVADSDCVAIVDPDDLGGERQCGRSKGQRRWSKRM